MARITARITTILLAVSFTAAISNVDSLLAGEEIRVVVEKPAVAKRKPAKRYLIITKQGKVFQGDVVSESPKEIRLRDSKGKIQIIARKDIEALRVVKKKSATKVVAKGPAVQIRRRGGVTSGTGGVRETVDPKDNTELLLFLSPKGPILVEIQMTLAGKPFRTMREKLVREMLKRADKNKDGETTWKEAFADAQFAFGRINRANNPNVAYRKAQIARYDADKNGIVSPYEVRLTITQIGYGTAFRVYTNNYSRSRQPDVKKVLDQNRDGTLSQAELKAAPERLKSRDANKNDLLESVELGGGTTGLRYSVQQRGVRLPARAGEVYLLGPAADLAAAYAGMIAKYAGKDGKIRANTFSLFPAMFKTLDLDKNGLFDSGESIGLHLLKPNVKLSMSVGDKEAKNNGITIKSIDKPLAHEAAREEGPVERLTLTVPGWKLRFQVPEMVTRLLDYTRTAQSQLTRYDKNKNGYIEKKEMGTNAYYLRQFASWDRNSDGKVYANEIKEMYDRSQMPTRSQIIATSYAQGPSLFATLDATGDKRLSLREMRTAAKRLIALDRNKNGKIDADEMPSELVVSFAQGGTYSRARFSGFGSGRTGRTTTPTARGPKWFVHMDKNGNGDITLREFLGTKLKFQELDTNKDGFIERKEAEAIGKQKSTSRKYSRVAVKSSSRSA